MKKKPNFFLLPVFIVCAALNTSAVVHCGWQHLAPTAQMPSFQWLCDAVDEVRANKPILGIDGPAGAGKTFVSNILAEHYRQQGRHVEIIGTDIFLLEAKDRGIPPDSTSGRVMLDYYKGIYDLKKLRHFLQQIVEFYGSTNQETVVTLDGFYDKKSKSLSWGKRNII